MKVGNPITKSDFEKPYDTCYGSRMRYSSCESPTRNATYWLQDLQVNDYFFTMLYKGRLIKGVLYDVVSKKNESEYRNLIADFLSDMGLVEDSLKYDFDINAKKQLVYEFDEILDFIDNTGFIKEAHISTREYWDRIKTKILCS